MLLALLFIDICFRSLAHTVLYITEAWWDPKQILMRHSRSLHKRDIPSAAFAGGKAPYDVLFSNYANFHLRCWFLRPAICLQKQFRVAQISSTRSKDIKCHASVSFVLIREPHDVFLGKHWHFSVYSAMFGIKRNQRHQAFYFCWGLGRQMTTVLSVSAQITI